ncbi:MAG: hypothetical protein ABI629_06080, partial [bacterium]
MPDLAAHSPYRSAGAIGMHLALTEDERRQTRWLEMDNEQIDGIVTASVAVNPPAVTPPIGEPPQLGGVIRYLRRQLGMTQEELA